MQVVCAKFVYLLIFLGVPYPQPNTVGAGQPPVGGVFAKIEDCEAFYHMAASKGATWPHTCQKMEVIQ
jgi:hypothetical protein